MRAEQVPRRLRELADALEQTQNPIAAATLLEAVDALEHEHERQRDVVDDELRDRVRTVRHALEVSGSAIARGGIRVPPEAEHELTRLHGAVDVLHSAVHELLSLVVVAGGMETPRPAGLFARTDGGA